MGTGDFTVLGAGVAGLAMATELSCRGAAVQIIDPAGPPGEHGCSWWAGGMLAHRCEGAEAEEPVVRHGRSAAGWWREKGAEVHSCGTVVVAPGRDRNELAAFARRVPAARCIEAEELAGLEPDLGERFSQALFVDGEAHLDPRRSLESLYERLEGEVVRDDRAQVIDCRGLAARDTLADLRGVKGEMVIVRSTDMTLGRPVRLLHPRFPLYVVPRGGGVFMLGATQIESGRSDRATVRSVMELLNAAFALHPAFAEAEIVEIGVGTRPAFADNQPRIRRIRDRICVNGLFRHGFLLAPALACMTADLLMEGRIPEDWYEDHR